MNSQSRGMGSASIRPFVLSLSAAARAALKQQQPCCVWLTGLSGSGKSTLANALEVQLNEQGRHTFVLDGDNLRTGLCNDLGMSDAARKENIRRIGEVARLMVDAGLIVLVALISPFRDDRDMARRLFDDGDFAEVFVDTPLAVCEARDPKGLYRKARAGALPNFTGIDSPYEPPEMPEIRIDGAVLSADEAAAQVVDWLREAGERPHPARENDGTWTVMHI